MHQGLFLRLLFCFAALSLTLYSYQNKQNKLTQLKILVPKLEKEIYAIREENLRLQYEIERMESPGRLIELAHHPEFSHLKHPLMKEILTVSEGIAMQSEKPGPQSLW